MVTTLGILAVGIIAIGLSWLVATQSDSRMQYMEKQRIKAERHYYFGGY